MSLEVVGKMLLILVAIALVSALIFMFAKSFVSSADNEISGVGMTCEQAALREGFAGEMVRPGQCDTSDENIILAKNTLDQADSGNVCCIDKSKGPVLKSSMTCLEALDYAKRNRFGYEFTTTTAKDDATCQTSKGQYETALFIEINDCCLLGNRKGEPQ